MKDLKRKNIPKKEAKQKRKEMPRPVKLITKDITKKPKRNQNAASPTHLAQILLLVNQIKKKNSTIVQKYSLNQKDLLNDFVLSDLFDKYVGFGRGKEELYVQKYV